jgi:hypothetical protein
VPTGTSNNGLSRAEPLPSGKSTLTLNVTVYLHDKTTYEDWANNNTPLQCKIVAKRGNYSMTLLFPRLAITSAEPNFDNAGSTALVMEASLPSDPTALAAIENSFAAERTVGETVQPWPQTSVFGLILTSQENRNPMRWPEVTVQASV